MEEEFCFALTDKKENSNEIKISSLAKRSQVKDKSLTQSAQ